MAKIVRVDPANPDPTAIARAAGLLRSGGLVAVPTETVYGLGANALDSAAVGRIFQAKGRPAWNPLIVHVAGVPEARKLAAQWPAEAERCAEQFWPGPLTMVLWRSPVVPDEVTAGGDTVAIRVPSHPVTMAILSKAGVPMAAPSANPSGAVSPTRAVHVLRGLGDLFDLLVDAGPTAGGLESTVVDLTCRPARILRPGPVTLKQLSKVLDVIHPESCLPADEMEPLRSPGRMKKHYSPRARLQCVDDEGRVRVDELVRQGKVVGWLRFAGSLRAASEKVREIEMPVDPREYASRLYAELHALDEVGVDWIVVASPPRTPEWAAVLDRLHRAASTD